MKHPELVPMLRARLRGCDTLETRDAIGRVERWLERLAASATVPINGTLQAPEAIGAQLETLYFDGKDDWPALAVRAGDDFILLDPEHAFVPA